MLNKNLISFFNKNVEVFLQQYAIASKSANADAIHDMRVSLKRIDTFVRMLNFEKAGNFRLKESFIPLRQLFKKAGPVRDFQVQETLIDKFEQDIEIDKQLKNRLIDEKNSLIGEFFREQKSFNKLESKRSFKLIGYYLENGNLKNFSSQIEDYHFDRLKNLVIFSNPSDGLFNLHNARKMLKDLAYLIEMTKRMPSEEDTELQRYKEAGHILGDWHDYAVMLNFLNKLRNNNHDLSLHIADSLIVYVKAQKELLASRYMDILKIWNLNSHLSLSH